jgi:hypothetical protein
MTTLAGNGTADLEFCDLALLPASGIVECFHAAGIDVSVAGASKRASHRAERPDRSTRHSSEQQAATGLFLLGVFERGADGEPPRHPTRP